MANRTPLMAGNWKMNLDHHEAIALVQKLAWSLKDAKHDAKDAEAAVIVPFTDIRSVQTLVDGDKLEIAYGAQDVSVHEKGAYTGEISTGMLNEIGVDYCVLGHSERRGYFGETDEGVNKRAHAAFAAGITPIICCGESLEIREAGTYLDFVAGQIKAALEGFKADEVAKLVIAYEPIWAIGTGKTATFEQAEEVCAHIRKTVAEKFNQSAADAIRIQYGGSVKPATIKGLMEKPNVDGALVGGASLKAVDFSQIVKF